MLELRQNRILFQYMEEVSVNYDDDTGWTIQGNSTEGGMFIYETTAGLARFVMPIPVPKEISIDPLLKIVSSAQAKVEGLLGVNLESETLVIEYYIHANLEDEKGLDAALIKFTQERKEIKNALEILVLNIREMVKGMNGMMAMMNGDMTSNNRNAPSHMSSESEDVWSTMADIEKNLDDTPDKDVDSIEEEEDDADNEV